MIVSKESGFFDPVFDDLLDPRAERDLTKGHGGTPAGQIPFNFQTDLFGRKSHLFQDHQGNPVGFTENGQDEMLGSEVVVLMTLSLFPCEDDDLPTLVRESLEHPASFLGGAYNKSRVGKPIEKSGLILTRRILSVKATRQSHKPRIGVDETCGEGMTFLARIIHEGFYCNLRYAAATS